MFKDIRVHGAISADLDYFAILAGEKLLPAPFYEIQESVEGDGVSFFLSGMYLKLARESIAFSGTGGIVSEYMFGSPMPLQDLGHKEVRNRLVLFGTFPGEDGRLSFTANVSGTMTYESLFLDGNALGNTFFLLKTPWPFSARRTQETLLRTLGRVLKRSEAAASGQDSELASEILRELAEPAATLLLLRLAHRPHQRFHQFARDRYRQAREWGDAQRQLSEKLGEELGVAEYQRERIVIDILYKDAQTRPIVDEYKDVLLAVESGEPSPGATARLNSLRKLAMRRGLPPSLFDTLDGLVPAKKALPGEERESVRAAREILEGLFLSSGAAAEALGKDEIARLLKCKQQAQLQRDSDFEQLLLDTGRLLDERAASGGDLDSLEAFSLVVTYFDRLDNAESLVNRLAFMENARAPVERVRSLAGNKREIDAVQAGLFRELVIAPVLINPYVLRAGRKKVSALFEGLERIERGECTLSDVAAAVAALAEAETAEARAYEAIRGSLKQSYFNLSNPTHARLLEREVEGEIKKRYGAGAAPSPGAFSAALEDVKAESEYLNNLYPILLDHHDPQAREAFIATAGLDRYRLEELEREYRMAHGVEE